MVGNGLQAQKHNPEIKVRGVDPVLTEAKETLERFNQVKTHFVHIFHCQMAVKNISQHPPVPRPKTKPHVHYTHNRIKNKTIENYMPSTKYANLIIKHFQNFQHFCQMLYIKKYTLDFVLIKINP